MHLASSPDVAGVTGAYYNKNITLVPWPEAVLDSPLRRRLWNTVERWSGIERPRQQEAADDRA